MPSTSCVHSWACYCSDLARGTLSRPPLVRSNEAALHAPRDRYRCTVHEPGSVAVLGQEGARPSACVVQIQSVFLVVVVCCAAALVLPPFLGRSVHPSGSHCGGFAPALDAKGPGETTRNTSVTLQIARRDVKRGMGMTLRANLRISDAIYTSHAAMQSTRDIHTLFTSPWRYP
jgi:hypothetical protein